MRSLESFCCSEKESKFQEGGQSEEVQLLLISSPSAVAETLESTNKDTSPAKTMAVLQSSRPGVIVGEEMTQEVINPAGSGQSSG